MTRASELYEYSRSKVGGRLVEALKRRKNASTVADLVAATGLPRVQVEGTIRSIADEYGGQLRVTETGEILYYFPGGMHSRTRGLRPFLRRAVGTFLRGAGRVLAFLFKVWITLMLVGYTVVFAAVVLLAVFGSFAAAASGRGEGRGRSRGGGFGTMFLASRLINLMFYMWMLNPPGRTYARGRPRKGPGRPLYRSVFAYAFGEEDVNRGWEEREKVRVIAFLRGSKGVITLEELMAQTGRTPAGAHELLNALLVEFEGDPSVTPEGTLVYRFPGLLASAGGPSTGGPPVRAGADGLPGRVPQPFSRNTGGANGWITFLNGFNLFFGAYFLYFSQFVPLPGDPFSGLYVGLGRYLAAAGVDPVAVMGLVLGAVPFAFSLLFYLIPLVRGRLLRRANEEIRRENLRRRVYREVLAGPGEVDPRDITPAAPEESPRDPQDVVRRTLDELAAMKGGEIERTADGHLIYRFPELVRELRDLETYRRSIDPAGFDIGKTVFDSGEGPPPPE